MDREGAAGQTDGRDWYERAFRAFVHGAYESPLRGRYTLEYLREYAANELLDREALRALQWRKLQALLRHCWEHVAFYREHWSAAITDPTDLRSPDDLRHLPPLERHHLRDDMGALLARTDHGPLVFRRTDGTTGPPLEVAYSRVDYERRQALMLRGYGWAGYEVGRRAAFLWGEPATRASGLRGARERLHHALFNRTLLDATRLTEQDLERHAARLRALRPRVVVGYAGALHALARWLLDNHQRVPRPTTVVSGAEPLAAHQRAAIAEAFAAPVRDTWGCREFSLIAAERAGCGRMHVNADQLLVESEPGPAPGLDRLLVTDLSNHAMPLVRYAVGDLGSLAQRDCPCGLPFPTIDRVVGRETEALRRRDGAAVHASALLDALADVAGVRQAQFAQAGDGPVEVRIAAGRRFDADEAARLRAALAVASGGGLSFTLTRVEQAPVADGGKTPLVVRAP